MAIPCIFFVYICCVQTFYTFITVDFSMIQTLIVRIEGERTDHLTTTTARLYFLT